MGCTTSVNQVQQLIPDPEPQVPPLHSAYSSFEIRPFDIRF